MSLFSGQGEVLFGNHAAGLMFLTVEKPSEAANSSDAAAKRRDPGGGTKNPVTPKRDGLGVVFQNDRRYGFRPGRRNEDEDKNLERVGSLERGKPILPHGDTLRHGFHGCFGARVI
jgi:hypothetical protein